MRKTRPRMRTFGQRSREHHGGEGGVGSAVHQEIDFQGEKPAVAAHPRPVADDRGVALGGGDNVLVPVVDHLDRPARGAGEQGGVDGNGAREILLAAETTAHGRGAHPHLLLLQPQGVDQGLVDVIRALHGAEHVDCTVPFEPGDHPLGLDVDVLLVPGPVLTLDDPVRSGEGALDIPV